MKNVEDAFFQGLVDGTADHEKLDKVAEAFFLGLSDGANDANHVPIMSKIAEALDFDSEAEVDVELEAATGEVDTVSDRVISLIRGE